MTHTGGATVLSTRRLKKKLKKKKTQKNLYRATLNHLCTVLHCVFLSSLCVSCVKQRKTLLEAVLTPGTGTRVFSFSMYQCLVIPAAKGGRYYRHLQLF